jgi:2,3-bisphosphoglycerate-dependent phosphoglycerate mutase
MVRAVSTASPIAQALDLPLYAWPEVHETGGIFSRIDGDKKEGLPGKNRSYFKKNYPDLRIPDWLDERGWWNRPFEEREARQPRSREVWSEILARHGDQPGRPEHRVAIVSHGGFYNYLLTSALGIELVPIEENRHQFWFLLNNCAISRLDYASKQLLICYHNRHEFLPDTFIT